MTPEHLTAQRDAWRKACRYLYDLMGEGSRRGRPMDCLSRDEWRRVVELIGKAEMLEETEE